MAICAGMTHFVAHDVPEKAVDGEAVVGGVVRGDYAAEFFFG